MLEMYIPYAYRISETVELQQSAKGVDELLKKILRLFEKKILIMHNSAALTFNST